MMSNSRLGAYWLLKVNLALCTTWLLFAPPLSAQQVTASDSQGVNLTIYNQDFGLVKDIRTVDLKDGLNYLRFEDVAAMIDPTSVSFISLSAPNAVAVREQNYQYDLMDPTTILSKSVGKTVRFKQFLANGQVEELTGILLNQPVASVSDTQGNVLTRHQGMVLKTADGIVLNPAGQVRLEELPAGLVSKPSLVWKLESSKAGRHQTEIAYQTGGLNWRCNYVVVSNVDDTSADLTSWVTIDNKSGATYKSASLKLLAGDVHKVEPRVLYRAKAELRAAESMAPQFKEQAFAEYHLYTLQGKTDVNQNETKQLSLFGVNGVPTKKLFIFEPAAGEFGYEIWHREDSQKIQVKLEIQNTEANHLGMPMPKGKIRVYKRDQDNALQFVGEDMIDHTPRDEKIRLYVGDAFDLVGERKQTNFQRISDHIQRMSYEISLRNHKDTPVTITAVEHSWGQWKILSSSQPYTKKDAKTLEFNVKVPARGEIKVTYDIEVKS